MTSNQLGRQVRCMAEAVAYRALGLRTVRSCGQLLEPAIEVGAREAPVDRPRFSPVVGLKPRMRTASASRWATPAGVKHLALKDTEEDLRQVNANGLD